MSFSFAVRAVVLLCVAAFLASAPSIPQKAEPRAYLGFDRNEYPGDDALPVLRNTFAFSSYWLSPPPGEKTDTWKGKRELLRSQGFGFLVLYRGPESRELGRVKNPRQKGQEDSIAASDAAEREGFPTDTVIFLDIEEGGRLSPSYHAYIHGWLWYLRSRQGRNYRGGFYCSGIPVREGTGKTITTCEDIFDDLWKRSRGFSLWAYNDVCPPSPGCAFPQNPPLPFIGDKSFCDSCIDVWQFAQSPRNKERTGHCPAKYSPDGNCYAPGDTAHRFHLDVNTAVSADPSDGAK